MRVTRIFADENGESHFEEVDVPLADGGSIGRVSDTMPATGIILRETDGTYDYSWHNPPQRRYVIMLRGRVEMTVSDGESRVFVPGEIVLLEDTTGRGHRSRALDGTPRETVFVTLDESVDAG